MSKSNGKEAGGALAGAAIGAALGGPLGAVIGGIAGAILGSEDEKKKGPCTCKDCTSASNYGHARPPAALGCGGSGRG